MEPLWTNAWPLNDIIPEFFEMLPWDNLRKEKSNQLGLIKKIILLDRANYLDNTPS